MLYNHNVATPRNAPYLEPGTKAVFKSFFSKFVPATSDLFKRVKNWGLIVYLELGFDLFKKITFGI
jgi:hypothetical protein